MTATATTAAAPAGEAVRGARHARFWLAVAAIMIAAIGLGMITVGVVTGQPGLTVVASSALAAGGASLASAYSVTLKSPR